MLATLGKENKKYSLYMSFTLVYLFLTQSLEFHRTNKSPFQPEPPPGPYIATWYFALGLSMQDLLTIWTLTIQRAHLNSLFTLLLHFGKRITSTLATKILLVAHTKLQDNFDSLCSQIQKCSPFCPQSVPPFKLLPNQANP